MSNNNNRNIDDTIIPPIAQHVGGLYKSVRKALKNQTLNFKINVECTSLKVSPSGNYLWGGFSDGTLRVWDLSGTFGVEDDKDSSTVVTSRQKMDVMVNSKLTQGYGAVACQIHARGVHTDLLTTVDISDDSQYIFMGVSRGATELYAVYIGDLENAVHQHKKEQAGLNNTSTSISSRNILDYLKVYCHSDGKLKGFGACATTRTIHTPTTSASVTDTTTTTTTTTSYLLLTGKGIKNIHIWKFIPPKDHPRSSSISYNDNYNNNSDNDDENDDQISLYDEEEDNGIWEQIYDTPTNGSSIHLLAFYRSNQSQIGANNGKRSKLLAVSKSGTQKVRLWDLSLEEEEDDSRWSINKRPKRPPFQDVDHSQSALEIAGGIGICGGMQMYNEMSIVSLDRPTDPFNHTELALPTKAANSSSTDAPDLLEVYSTSRRQRRGEMKAVVNVATSPRDSSHALLELDDGSLIGYSAGSSTTKDFHGIVPRLAMASPESTGIPALPADFWRRCICLANVAGVVIAASSLYNPNTNKGQLVIRALGGLKKPRGDEQKQKQKQQKKQQQKQKQQRQLKSSQQQAQQQQQQSIPTPKPVSKPVTVTVTVPQTTTTTPPPQLQSSPIAADQQALRNAVSAPPPLSSDDDDVSTNTNKNLLRDERSHPSTNATTGTGTTGPLSSSVSSSSLLTRVSPDQKQQTNIIMETPIHHPKKLHEHEPQSLTNSMITATTTTTSTSSANNTDNDSPESKEGLPNISKYLVPKRIVMQPQQQQQPPMISSTTKKRKASSVLATVSETASATKINTGIESSSGGGGSGGGGLQSTSFLSKKELKAIKKAKKAAAAVAVAAKSVVAPGQEKSTVKTDEMKTTEVLPVIMSGKKKKEPQLQKNTIISPNNEFSTVAMVMTMDPTVKLNSIGTIPINVPPKKPSSGGGLSIKFKTPPTTKTTQQKPTPTSTACVSAAATAAAVSSRNLITPSSVVTEKKRDRPTVAASVTVSATIVTAAPTTKKVVVVAAAAAAAHSKADFTTALLLTTFAATKTQQQPTTTTKSKEVVNPVNSSMTCTSARHSKSTFVATSLASKQTSTSTMISPPPSLAPPPPPPTATSTVSSCIAGSKSKATTIPSSTTSRKPTITNPIPSYASIKSSSNAAIVSASKSTHRKTTTGGTTIQQQQQPQPPSREVMLHEKITEQYKQLRSFLQTITNRSIALIHTRNLRGPVPSALVEKKSASSSGGGSNSNLGAYALLLTEHRAAHDYLQQRLLRSAETTLLLLLEASITVEEARTELKHTIKRFEEILYDLLHRQEIERLGLVAAHHFDTTTTTLFKSSGSRYSVVGGGKQRSSAASPLSPGSAVPKQTTTTRTPMTYPCQAAFEKVEEICAVITRPVGRPKRGND